MIGSCETNISVLASAKSILAELLCSDILRKHYASLRVGVGAYLKVGFTQQLLLAGNLKSCLWVRWGGSCQIITQQVFSITCCIRAVLQRAPLHPQVEKHTHRNQPPPFIFAYTYFYPVISLTHWHYQGDDHSQPKNSRGPPW